MKFNLRKLIDCILLVSFAAFRPIREDNRMVPISPTKIEVPFHPSWNVTGKGGGKADYRRRTVEYVDSNSRDYKGKNNG